MIIFVIYPFFLSLWGISPSVLANSQENFIEVVNKLSKINLSDRNADNILNIIGQIEANDMITGDRDGLPTRHCAFRSDGHGAIVECCKRKLLSHNIFALSCDF